MNNQYRPSGFSILPPVVKNVLIINIIFFIATLALERQGIDLNNILGLHYISSPLFQVYQFATYMFMHANFSHLFFNMFALWMFGNLLENVMGSKRFLTYYVVTGIGAGIVQTIVYHFQISSAEANMTTEQIQAVYNQGADLLTSGRNFLDSQMGYLNLLLNTSTIGASGAVFGILLAFGMLFPNQRIYFYFLIPIKAKWFVIIYGVLELFAGVSNSVGDNVAHFAHLGGMIFGLLLLLYWRKKNKRNDGWQENY